MEKLVTIAIRTSTCLFAALLALGCGGEPSWTPSSETSGTPSRNLDCDAAAVQSYFAGTCASGMGDMLACWMPAGQCTATVDPNGYDVTFDSGAVLEHTYTADGQGVTARYVNANGEECGTFMTVGDFVDGNWRVAYETSAGEEYELRSTGNGNEYEIACSNGETVVVSEAEQQRLQECTGSDAVAICTQPGNVDVGNFDDILDAVGQSCTDNSQCPSGAGVELVCCNVFGESLCYESYACSFL